MHWLCNAGSFAHVAIAVHGVFGFVLAVVCYFCHILLTVIQLTESKLLPSVLERGVKKVLWWVHILEEIGLPLYS